MQNIFPGTNASRPSAPAGGTVVSAPTVDSLAGELESAGVDSPFAGLDPAGVDWPTGRLEATGVDSPSWGLVPAGVDSPTGGLEAAGVDTPSWGLDPATVDSPSNALELAGVVLSASERVGSLPCELDPAGVASPFGELDPAGVDSLSGGLDPADVAAPRVVASLPDVGLPVAGLLAGLTGPGGVGRVGGMKVGRHTPLYCGYPSGQQDSRPSGVSLVSPITLHFLHGVRALRDLGQSPSKLGLLQHNCN